MTTTAARQALQLSLSPLPYPEDALAPVISAETLRFHHGKHHKKYVDTANQLLKQEPVEAGSLEELVRKSSGKLFNNAAQVWNHDFYWKSLSPQPNRPEGLILEKINQGFGGWDAFAKKLAQAASGQFGSGWAWLIQRAGKLEIVTTANADTPMAKEIPCLLTIDVWEHAYYIDYRNIRDDYLAKVIDQRLNWKFAAENLAKAK